MAGLQTNKTSNIKVLSVVWFTVLPPKYGGQNAVAFFNKYLAELAPLVCLCARSNERLKTTYRVDNRLPVGKNQVFNPFVWRTIYSTVKSECITHIILEFPYHGIAGMLCKKLLGVKLIVNTHNIEYSRFKEGGRWWWPLLYRLERQTLRAADAVFFKTSADLQAAQKTFRLKAEKLSLLPYGVEEKKGFDKTEAGDIIRRRHGIKKDEKILLFAGTLDYAPNAEAVINLVEKIIPALDKLSLPYKIIVCGRNRFKAFQHLNNLIIKGLIIAGEVADIDTYYGAADAFINPVLSGGGVQTKTLDALSYHLNVVGFLSKDAGTEAAGDKLFLVEDGDWTAFANAIIKALDYNNPTPAAFFAANDWRTIASNAYQKIMAC